MKLRAVIEPAIAFLPSLVLSPAYSTTDTWIRSYDMFDLSYPHAILQTSDKGYIVTGTASANNGDFFLIKTDGLGNEDNLSSKSTNYQNYPNPFNSSTRISYSLSHAEFVTLKIYDLRGKEITTIVGEHQDQGNYTYDFDASAFSAGIYFYRLQAGSFVQTKKMTLAK